MNIDIPRGLMVVGCRPGSLGHAIAMDAQDSKAFSKGVWMMDHPDNAQEGVTYALDLLNRKSVVSALEQWRPTDVVCTAGINLPDGEPGTTIRNMSLQLQANVFGPTQLLVETVDMWQRSMMPPPTGFNFVAISSNSAHVARSESAGYCASKAALSMTLRSLARRWASERINIWGYEPGWINGTPMSDEVARRMKVGVKPHRIPSGVAVRRDELAEQVCTDVIRAQASFNGCMFRVDGGEQ